MNKGQLPDDRLAGPNAKVAAVLPLWQIVAGLTLVVILAVLSTQCSNAPTSETVPDAVDTLGSSLASDLQAAVGPDIGTALDGSTAVLTGEVATESAKIAAGERALALPAITAVDNHLTVLAAEADLAPPAVTAVDNQPVIARQPLLAMAAANGNYSTFLSAVETAGLTATLNGPGPFTVFAPTDAAFSSMPSDSLSELLANPESLATLLLKHTVEGSVSASEIGSLDGALTIGGATILFETIDQTTTVDAATLVDPDLVATNGIMHGVGAVLDPQILVATNPEELQAALADLEPITFRTGSADITAEGQEILGRAAETIQAIGSDVLIAGHTDDQGDATVNQALSEARAASVAAYLVTLGVPEELLSTVGFGESQPVADNGTSVGRAQNRRIEFVVENAS